MAQMSHLGRVDVGGEGRLSPGPVGIGARTGQAHDRCFAFQATGS